MTLVREIGIAVWMVIVTLWLQSVGLAVLILWIRRAFAGDLHRLGPFRAAALVVRLTGEKGARQFLCGSGPELQEAAGLRYSQEYAACTAEPFPSLRPPLADPGPLKSSAKAQAQA
jgi:hypothetical protein